MIEKLPIAIKKRASHPSATRELDKDFRKLVDELKQAEITMNLEEIEILKLQYTSNIQTTSFNNIQDPDNEMAEQITQIYQIYEKNTSFKDKPSFDKPSFS